MKLNKSLVIAAAALTVVGGSVLGIGAYGMSQDADDNEVASLDSADQTHATEEANTTATTNDGVEQYRGGGHAGGGHGFGHAGGRGFGGRGFGGRGFGGHGWGRGFGRGFGGHGWGWGRGYRACGFYGYWCY